MRRFQNKMKRFDLPMTFVTYMTWMTCFLMLGQSYSRNITLEEKYNACDCKDKQPGKKATNFHAIPDKAQESFGYRIACCAKQYIGLNNGDFNVTWSFIGEKTPKSTLKSLPECFGQILATNRVDVNESGNHSCQIATESGITFTKFVMVTVQPWRRETATPIAYNVSDTIYTNQGSSIIMNCTYYLEMNSFHPNVYWRKYWLNDSGYDEHFASSLGNTRETRHNFSKGNTHYFVFQLHVSNVTSHHFGNYSCLAITDSTISFQNITVIEGLDGITKKQLEWRNVLIGAIFGHVLFLLLLFLVFRFRFVLRWKWKKFKAPLQDPVSGFSHDIFLIHGPSTAFWVYGTLMEKLEVEWSYDCFSPDRDMLAGEVSTEVICKKLCTSRHIVIVVSDCFLESQWCSYVALQAIHKSLTNSTRIIAITLIDLNVDRQFPEESQTLVNILRSIKKIRYPLDVAPMTLVSLSNENPFELGQGNDGRKAKFSPHIKQSINQNNNAVNNGIANKQLKSIPNSYSSPSITNPCISQFSSSSTSLPSLLATTTVEQPTCSFSKVSPPQNSPGQTIKQPKIAKPNTSTRFLHTNMIIGSSGIIHNEATSQETRVNQPKHRASNTDKAKGELEYVNPKNNSDFGILENKMGLNGSSSDANLTTKHSKTLTAKELENTEACQPLNTTSQNNLQINTKKKVGCLTRLIKDDPTNVFWQKLRLHLPVKSKEEE